MSTHARGGHPPGAQGSNLATQVMDSGEDCKSQSCFLCQKAESGTESASRRVQAQGRHVKGETQDSSTQTTTCMADHAQRGKLP